MKTLKFRAEVKKVQVKSTISSDRELELVLVTNDMSILDLGKVVSIKTILVEIRED